MAAPAWKLRFRQRAVSAQGLLGGALGLLQLVKAFLEMHPERAAVGQAAWTAAFRLRLVLARQRLALATRYLNSAAVSMEAAEILALHGASPVHVALPLQSIHHLAPPDALALGYIENSRLRALEACESTEWLAAHLSTQIALLDTHAAFPDAMNYEEAEEDNAGGYLTFAMRRTEAALQQVTAALQHLTP